MDLYFEKDYFCTRSSAYTKIHIHSNWKVGKHELDLLEIIKIIERPAYMAC